MTIFNSDGTVYMTLPTPVPSNGDLEGWMVRQVTSGSHTAGCRVAGTRASVETGPDSFNGLLRLISDTSAWYGYRVTSSRITPGTFRWTWEARLRDGHRVTDMIIASRIH